MCYSEISLMISQPIALLWGCQTPPQTNQLPGFVNYNQCWTWWMVPSTALYSTSKKALIRVDQPELPLAKSQGVFRATWEVTILKRHLELDAIPMEIIFLMCYYASLYIVIIYVCIWSSVWNCRNVKEDRFCLQCYRPQHWHTTMPPSSCHT